MAKNEFELAGRAKKVNAMVAYFDVELPRNHNIDPIGDPRGAADKLRSFTPLEWRQHAVIAGQRPPSDETISEIVLKYEGRAFEAEGIVASRRIGWSN